MRQQDGVTVLMVSHDLDQARRIADRVTLIDRLVVADGPPADALAEHIADAAANAAGAGPPGSCE